MREYKRYTQILINDYIIKSYHNRLYRNTKDQFLN